MRKLGIWALGAAVVAFAATTVTTAEAGHRRYRTGWGHVPTVVHYGYYPRYNHVYVTHYATDPYAYHYVPRGYYPYYNSGYWRPAAEVRSKKRRRHAHPPYYKAWGYPSHGYRHHEWHAEHHGPIRRHHW
jgi:hypothetical protein